MERLLEISRELISTVSLENLLFKIVRAAAELTDCEAAGILLFDEDSGELRFVAASMMADQLADIPVPVEDSVAGAAFISGEPIIVPDVRVDPRYYPLVEQLTGFKARSLLAVPLQFQSRRIGVLEVENRRDDGEFDSKDVEILTALAAQAAVAVENARLVERLEQTRDELREQIKERERLLEAEREQIELAEALRQASAAFGGTLDYDEVLDRILEQVSRVVPRAAANIMLIEGNIARILRGRGYENFGTATALETIFLDLEEVSGFRRMRDTGQPMVISDVEQDEEWVYSRPEHDWIKSYAGVPICVRDEVIGFLNVNSAIPGFFDQADAEHLQAFADHAAIAIENARLYEQAQRELAERMEAEAELRKHHDHLEDLVNERAAELIMAVEQLEEEINERAWAERTLQRRNRELAAINAVAQALSTSLELQDILEQALLRTVEALGFEGGLIALVQERTGDLALFCHTGLPHPLVENLKEQGLHDTLCDLVYRGGEPLCLEDLRQDTSLPVQKLLDAGLQSYVGAPISYQERILGTFCLVDTRPRSVSESDHELLVTIGQQMGVTVENVRLYRDVLRERQASQTMLDTAKALSTTLRLDRLLERVLDELQRVVPYDAVLLSMVHDERCWAVAARGQGHVPAGRFLLSEQPLVAQVVRARDAVIIPDVSQASDWSPGEASSWVRSWLGVPLIVKDHVIGVLTMDSRHPYTYDHKVARLAAAFAQQVAMAIENARLYEQVQAKLREATLLHSVTAALSFTLDLDQILPYMARSLCEILNGTGVEIYSLDQETGVVTVVANYLAPWAADKDRILDVGETYELADHPVMNKSLDQRRPIQGRVGDPETDPRLQDWLERRQAQTVLLLPMVTGEQVLGLALVCEFHTSRQFTEGEITMGQALIHQAAVAVYNARLVEALRQYTVELETQNAELDAFAHTVAHDLKTPLTSLIGFSDLLEKRYAKMSEEKLQGNLHIIAQSGRKMRSIIDELLLLASVRKMEDVDTRPLNMADIIGEVQGRLADSIAEYQAEFILPEDWPTASGYGPWIEEVWTNYISNALKYGGQPPQVELGATEQENGIVRFWVRDNGPGLSPEEQAQLFTPFTRLHQLRAKGHGLGLSIVQRVVEKLGGEVGVESAGVPGEGSTFFFTLPEQRDG